MKRFNSYSFMFRDEFPMRRPNRKRSMPKFKRPDEMKDDDDYDWERDDEYMSGVSDPGEDLLEESYDSTDYDLIWPYEQDDIKDEGWAYTTPYKLAKASEPTARRLVELVDSVEKSGEGFTVGNIKRIAKAMRIPLDTITVDDEPLEDFSKRKAEEYIEFGGEKILQNIIIWLNKGKVKDVRFNVINRLDGEYEEGEYFFDNINFDILWKMLRKWHAEGRR